MSIKRYFFSIFLLTTPLLNLLAQNITQQSSYSFDSQTCKSDYVYEGDESTEQFFEVLISLEPVPQY